MNEAIQRLQLYPFERLAAIRATLTPPSDKKPIDLSIGEPKHPTPPFILATLAEHLPELSKYPVTRGSESLRETIAEWLIRRYQLPPASLSARENILPVNGTREALFAIAQSVVSREKSAPIIVMPNPFYQIYEGAALLAGAEPWFVNCHAEQDYFPDYAAVPESVWERCQLLYLCSPGNPTGAVLPFDILKHLIALADRHDFIIAADECYSEIYLQEQQPPLGLLQAAAQLGRTDYRRCLVFHSLSKRSNVPGLRSGFVAGDADIIEKFFLYRTYHGCAMPLYVQAASQSAWRDERHVQQNRQLYREKFDAVLDILSPVLDVQRPTAGFYLWPKLPVNDVDFCHGLMAAENITVLPGSFLSRTANGKNPGNQHVRIALVASLEECVEAATRIKNFVTQL
jgi:N-succinyldiaminopimelate aminotransferase